MQQTSSNGRSKVAILAPRISELGHDPCGGSELMLWEDARLLRTEGIQVQVYGAAAKLGAPVNILRLRTNRPLITSWEYCTPFAVRESRSILMACNEPTVAGLAPDRAIVRFEWETALPRYWKLPGWLPRFQRAKYLFLSESDREEFLKNYALIPPEAAVTIPYFVDLQLFRPTKTKNGNALRVGFAGQWVHRKGCAALLEAWNIVRQTCQDAELWFAGSDKLWKTNFQVTGANEIGQQVRNAASEGWLKIAGEFSHREMPRFWNELDIAVVPSFEEPFGLVALEALACGVPVVASTVGGLKEIVVDGENGLLVQPRDPAALARALITLIKDEPLRLRLAQAAIRRAGEYSLKRRREALLRLVCERQQSARQH